MLTQGILGVAASKCDFSKQQPNLSPTLDCPKLKEGGIIIQWTHHQNGDFTGRSGEANVQMSLSNALSLHIIHLSVNSDRHFCIWSSADYKISETEESFGPFLLSLQMG